MMRNLCSYVENDIAQTNEQRARGQLSLAVVAGSESAIEQGFTDLIEKSRGKIAPPPMIVVVDEAGYRHCTRNGREFPYDAVRLLVAVGLSNQFPLARTFVCSGGKVRHVLLPLSDENRKMLLNDIREAARMCGF